MIEHRRITIYSDGTQSAPMQWPHNTVVESIPLQPSLDPSCAVATCTQQANPLNTVEAKLDVFGSPTVRVVLCDEHFHLFGETTAEHETPDIVTEER